MTVGQFSYRWNQNIWKIALIDIYLIYIIELTVSDWLAKAMSGMTGSDNNQHRQHGFCFVPASTSCLLTFVLFWLQQHTAFVLFPCQQHGCQNWQQLVWQGEVAWIFTRQGYIKQVSHARVMKQVSRRALSDSLSDWQGNATSDLGLIKTGVGDGWMSRYPSKCYDY